VDVPGSEGDFGVLAGHSPFVTTLRPGILTMYREDGDLRVVVTGGFAEVSDTSLTILADVAVPVDDVNPDAFAGFVREADEAAAKAPEGPQRDKLALRADQLRQLQTTLAH
jgi:F-type H+-transporting ATPase subunit epsilon